MNYSRLIIVTTITVVFIYSLLYPFITDNRTSESEISDNDTKKPIVNIEKPLHNVELPNFAAINDVRAKKKQFFSFIQPAVVKENKRILALRKQLLAIKAIHDNSEPLSEQNIELIKELGKRYRVKSTNLALQLDALLIKIDIIPKALILVQAANESAWGTSRFARIGLNFFGIWCYQKGCGMVPNSRNEGADHEVAAYSSVDQAVQRYLKNLNTNQAYAVFRTIRKQLRDNDQPLSPNVLATGLLPYSERGSAYVEEISDMIRHNQHYFATDTGS
ncbi:MAG: glucosaminidase domain-containing protein [Thalassotalea sp.]